jgi:hypothetical protein
MTKGGVMMGSTVSRRMARLPGKAVRVTMRAKQRPSIVAAEAVKVARARVFQNTPQLTPPVRQPRPPDLAVGQPVHQRGAGGEIAARGEHLAQHVHHRPGGEEQDGGDQDTDRAGDEAVPLEQAAQGEAIGEQHHQPNEGHAAAEADAELAVAQFAVAGFEPGEGPALDTDGEALSDQREQAEAGAEQQEACAGGVAPEREGAGQR